MTKDTADRIMGWAAGHIPTAEYIELAQILLRALEGGHEQST